MTREPPAFSRSRITFESIHTFRGARWALLVLLATFACEERFTGVEDPAAGGAGGSNAGSDGSGASGGSPSTGGKAGAGGSGGSDAGSPASGGTSDGGTSSGGSGSGGTSGGSTASGGAAGEPGVVEPEIPTEGLLLWLRADRGVTQADGVVSKWEDGSGAGNDATQTASNVRPAFVSDAFGARPALAFDEDDFLRLPAGFSDFSAGLSVFGLASFDESTSCTSLFHLGNGPEVDDIELGHLNGTYLYEVADQYPEGSAFEFKEPALLAVVHRPTTSVEMRWNQNLEAAPTMVLPASVERTDNVVGRSLYSTCTAMRGKLAELIIYDRAVSDEELVDIELYLQQRYDCCSN